MQNGDRPLRQSLFRQSILPQQSHLTLRQIIDFIDTIKPKPNTPHDYDTALSTWNQFSISYKLQIKKANNVLMLVPKLSPNSSNCDLCQVCYQEITKNKNWCRICGNQCCQKCIARLRIINKQTPPILFCQKCDKDYITSIIRKQQQKKFLLRQKSFLTLATQQQQLQKAIKIQKDKLQKDQPYKNSNNQMLKKLTQITQITQINALVKNELDQLKKRIQFGQSQYHKLKRKYKHLKKEILNSSNCSSAHQEPEGTPAPTVDDSDFTSFENLNQSIINSMLQTTPVEEEIPKFKCHCYII